MCAIKSIINLLDQYTAPPLRCLRIQWCSGWSLSWVDCRQDRFRWRVVCIERHPVLIPSCAVDMWHAVLNLASSQSRDAHHINYLSNTSAALWTEPILIYRYKSGKDWNKGVLFGLAFSLRFCIFTLLQHQRIWRVAMGNLGSSVTSVSILNQYEEVMWVQVTSVERNQSSDRIWSDMGARRFFQRIAPNERIALEIIQPPHAKIRLVAETDLRWNANPKDLAGGWRPASHHPVTKQNWDAEKRQEKGRKVGRC